MADEIKLNEIDSTSVDKLITILSTAYSKLINDKKPLDLFPSVMLWGQPGVGKSVAIKQLAKNIENETNKKVVVIDVRLLLFNPIDLRGIPVANEDKTLAVWLKPKIFQMDNSKDIINILFLDEISAAPQSVQAAAYQITLDRTVGEHKLPDNCIVIAAGNRISDKSVAYKMPKALANRLMHFNISTSFDNWKRWALHNNIHPMVIGFLGFKSNLLNTFDSSKEQLAFSTPRSWEMVSNILNNTSDDLDFVFPFISGLVGSSAAFELKSWVKIYKNLPKVEDIFSGEEQKVPKTVSELFAVCAMMVQYAKKVKNDTKKITNSIIYAQQFPKEFSILLIDEYLSFDVEFKNKLLQIPEFYKLVSKSGEVLNGINSGIFS